MNHIYEVLLGWHEAFRKYGFTSDEIYVAPPAASGDPVHCVVRVDGKEASTTIHVGDGFTEEGWAAATRKWNASELDRETIYKNWLAGTNTVALVMALMNKGFDSVTLKARPKWREAEKAKS